MYYWRTILFILPFLFINDDDDDDDVGMIVWSGRIQKIMSLIINDIIIINNNYNNNGILCSIFLYAQCTCL